MAACDATAIADSGGVVRFAQVGYGCGDEALWREALEAILAGKSVEKTSSGRERLRAGDRLPAVELPSLMSGKRMALVGENGRLTFRSESGSVSHPPLAIGFFSRY